MRATILALLCLLVACDVPSLPQLSAFRAQAMQPVGSQDDTARIQAAIAAGACMPPGDFYAVTPPLPRHDWVLRGCPCGSGAANTRIHFVGDGGGKFWVGVALVTDCTIADVALDTVGLINADPNGKNGYAEQTHLTRMYGATNNVTIRDAIMNHPIGGDCVNVVGSAPPAVPNVGLAISHVTFERCSRGGVQVSRSLAGLVITDSTFVDTGFDVGSEGAGGYRADGSVMQTVTDAIVGHNRFSSPRSGGFAIQAEWWLRAEFAHNVSDTRPWELYGTDDAHFSYNSISTTFPSIAALVIGDRGWRITSTGDSFAGVAGSVVAGQLGRGRPNDVGDLSFASDVLTGDVTLRGVTGAEIADDMASGQLLTPAGLAANGQPNQQTTGVLVTP